MKACKKNLMVSKTYLIYGDGSFKAPAHNPNGRERAGWGVAKFEVVQEERPVMLKPVYNLGGRVVTPNSLQHVAKHDLGAQAESNDTGEWSALGRALRDVLRELDNDKDLVLEVEFRQGCYDAIKKLLNGEVVLQNALLIRGVKKLWRQLLNRKRVPSVFLGHVCARGKCVIPDRADRVAKLGADGKFSAHGEFADIAKLHSEYKKQFDLVDDDDVVLGTHTDVEGSDEEILACVDASCDNKTKSCGHAFTLSDGDCEHSGLGAFVPGLMEAVESKPERLVLKGSLLATIAALECALKANAGRRKPITVHYLRKSLGGELVIGRLSKLSPANRNHQEIVQARAIITKLTMEGCEVTFKVGSKTCQSMKCVVVMAAQARKRNGTGDAVHGGQAKEIFEEMPPVLMKGKLRNVAIGSPVASQRA